MQNIQHANQLSPTIIAAAPGFSAGDHVWSFNPKQRPGYNLGLQPVVGWSVGFDPVIEATTTLPITVAGVLDRMDATIIRHDSGEEVTYYWPWFEWYGTLSELPDVIADYRRVEKTKPAYQEVSTGIHVLKNPDGSLKTYTIEELEDVL